MKSKSGRPVVFDELKLGDVIAPDMDSFIGGEAQVVVSKTKTHVDCEAYHMSVRYPVRSMDARLSKEQAESWVTRGETIDGWKARVRQYR